VLIAAYLHDVIEDVAPFKSAFSGTNIGELFGLSVLSLVWQLTDQYTPAAYPSMNRSKRKSAETGRLATVSDDALKIKLADIIENTFSIEHGAPKFARVYVAEKNLLLDAVAHRVRHSSDAVLRALYSSALILAGRKLNQ
jgi:(p)ppGpp synthase/HD superfamily hydrolase